MRRKLILVGAIAVIAVLGTALGTGAATKATKAKKQVTVALFVAIQSNPVEQAIINNFQAVAKKDGAVKFVVFDSNNSVQKEIANCNDAIAAEQVRRVRAQGCRRPAADGLRPQGAQGGDPGGGLRQHARTEPEHREAADPGALGLGDRAREDQRRPRSPTWRTSRARRSRRTRAT